ncbi:MAG: hypothetical protein ACLSH6_03540 [Limosilactobacillus pontis]
MKVQIINEKDLNSLTNLKVVKRDGTVTDFYAYKIDLVLNALHADDATQQMVTLTLVDALADESTVTAPRIATLFVEGLRKPTILNWLRFTWTTDGVMRKVLQRQLIRSTSLNSSLTGTSGGSRECQQG